MEIRFSRHAKNKIRLFKLTREEVEEVIRSGERLSQKNKWESRLGDLRVFWVMIDPYALVVTVIKTRRR